MQRHDGQSQGRPSVARDERGVVAIEFALVLPLILMVLFLIIDFGRVFNYVNDANQIAADGARYAAVSDFPGGGSLQDFLRAQASTAEFREGGTQISGPVSVCIEFPSGSSNVGDPVLVRVTSDFTLLPIIGDSLTVDIHGEATMRLERVPTYAEGCG